MTKDFTKRFVGLSREGFASQDSTMSSRRFMTDLKDAYARHYLARLPHYNSIIGYLEKPELTPHLKQLIELSSLPLKSIEKDFAVDASGFSTATYSRWFSAKYGKEMDQHDWIKVHLMCGVKTNIVTSVEIAGRTFTIRICLRRWSTRPQSASTLSKFQRTKHTATKLT